MRVLIDGIARAAITRYHDGENYIEANVVEKEDIPCTDRVQEQVLMRRVQELIKDYFNLYEKINPQSMVSIMEIDDGGELADVTASNFPLKPQDQQVVLEELDVQLRLEKLIALMENENNILEIEKGVMSKLQTSLDKNQRDYILREQMKVIQEELGDFESGAEEADSYREKIKNRKLPDEVKQKLEEELLFEMES